MFPNIKDALIAGKTVSYLFFVFFALIPHLQEFLNVAPKMQELHIFYIFTLFCWIDINIFILVFNSEISVRKLHNLFDSCHLQLSENIKIVPCYLIDTVNKKDNKTQSIT